MKRTYADEKREAEALEPSESLLRIEIARSGGAGWRWSGLGKLIEWVGRVLRAV